MLFLNIQFIYIICIYYYIILYVVKLLTGGWISKFRGQSLLTVLVFTLLRSHKDTKRPQREKKTTVWSTTTTKRHRRTTKDKLPQREAANMETQREMLMNLTETQNKFKVKETQRHNREEEDHSDTKGPRRRRLWWVFQSGDPQVTYPCTFSYFRS